MLFIHEGNPGSGKSYDVQSRIIDALQAGRVVYSNVDGHDDQKCRQAIAEICDLSRRDLDARFIYLTDEQVGEFWLHVQPGSLIVIDEIHKWFNARDWTQDRNRQFANWCSTHRHEGYDLCMITQRANKIDGQARSMVEWRYFYRRINFFGSLFKKGYLIYCYSGDDAKPLTTKKASYDVRFFKCYHSYKGNAIEKAPVKNANILKHPIFYGLGLVVALVGYFFSQSSFKDGDVLGIGKTTANIEKAIQSTSDLSKEQPAQVPPAEGGTLPVVSTTRRKLSDPVVVPVTAYAKAADGREFVYVGRHRLDSWLSISSDKTLVTVRSDTLPAITPGYEIVTN